MESNVNPQFSKVLRWSQLTSFLHFALGKRTTAWWVRPIAGTPSSQHVHVGPTRVTFELQIWVPSGFVCSFHGGPTCVCPYGLQMGSEWVSGGAHLGETHVGPICLPICCLSGIRMGPFSQPAWASHVGLMLLLPLKSMTTHYPCSPYLTHVGPTWTC